MLIAGRNPVESLRELDQRVGVNIGCIGCRQLDQQMIRIDFEIRNITAIHTIIIGAGNGRPRKEDRGVHVLHQEKIRDGFQHQSAPPDADIINVPAAILPSVVGGSNPKANLELRIAVSLPGYVNYELPPDILIKGHIAVCPNSRPISPVVSLKIGMIKLIRLDT